MSEEAVESITEEESLTESDPSGSKKELGAGKKPKIKLKLVALVICAVLVVVAVGGVLAAFATGVFAPADAAAKYNLFDYISETETTDYIETYKEQMGFKDASDKEWATFLASYNMTPERLRASTIDQLLTDKIVRDKCQQLGISISQEELDTAVQQYKDSYASGSDSIWLETLSRVGQDEQGFREGIELSMLKEKLAQHEVPTPEVSDDEVKTAIATYIDGAVSNEQSLLLKHTYCFRKSKTSSEGSLAESEEVEKIRKGLLDVGASEESFASIVELYSDDEDLKKNAGANGWNADTSGYSDEYVKALETVGAKGAVSSVFQDDDGYFFIWVSDTYELPSDSTKASKIDLTKMPKALHQYFTDIAAMGKWQVEAQTYLANITKDVDVTVFSMPSDVPYNVDMGLADTNTK